MKPDFSKFENNTNINFNDKRLLTQAFIHRSYINENRELNLDHNERLEFLGDAVLELIITDFLYHKYPHGNEGDLTSYRAALVNTMTLSEAATDLGMEEFLLLSKGESKDKGRGRQYILANTFEAVVGAIYLDRGYEKARDFVDSALFHRTDEIVKNKLWQDAKSFFQEKAQDEDGLTPAYKTISESGPDHAKTFIVGVYIGNNLIAQGEGLSKQEAEQEAAENALKKKGWR